MIPETLTPLTVFAGYLALVTLASLAAIVLYWIDKRSAVAGGRRIPETTLHWVSLAGGWPGAIFAQQYLHHKTQKRSFRIVFWLTVLLHIIMSLCAIYWILNNRADSA